MSIVDSFVVTKLIDLVRANRCIYDPRDPQHTNRALVNSVWKMISSEMGVPETLCREKWANLRSNYARELRKARRKLTEEGHSNKPASQWVFYESMSFLAPFVRSRLATYGMNGEIEEVQGHFIKIERDDSWQADNSGGESSGSGVLCEFTPSEPPSKRKRTSASSEQIIDPLFIETRSQDDSLSSADDDKLFLLSLHSKMKQLPLADNLSFRVEVQTMLMNKLLAIKSSTKECQTPHGLLDEITAEEIEDAIEIEETVHSPSPPPQQIIRAEKKITLKKLSQI